MLIGRLPFFLILFLIEQYRLVVTKVDEVPKVLVCGDSDDIRNEIKSGLSMLDCEFVDARNGYEVMSEVSYEDFDLIVLDMQTGKMGGMATCLEIRLEESGGRCEHVPVLLLVERRPDVFLARRAQADGFLVKPLNPIKLYNAATALIEGGSYEDESYLPELV